VLFYPSPRCLIARAWSCSGSLGGAVMSIYRTYVISKWWKSHQCLAWRAAGTPGKGSNRRRARKSEPRPTRPFPRPFQDTKSRSFTAVNSEYSLLLYDRRYIVAQARPTYSTTCTSRTLSPAACYCSLLSILHVQQIPRPNATSRLASSSEFTHFHRDSIFGISRKWRRPKQRRGPMVRTN
jgi:hypothetical protein